MANQPAKIKKSITVIGGGIVGVDAARSAIGRLPNGID